MTSLSQRRKPIPMFVITALLWSTSGIFVKALDWQPVSTLAGHGIFTNLVFLLYAQQRCTLDSACGGLCTCGKCINPTSIFGG